MKPMATEHKVREISFRPSTHVIIADTHGKNLLTVNIESHIKVFHPVVRFCPVREKVIVEVFAKPLKSCF